MDKEVLEVALKRCVRESSLRRILEVETESALSKGENVTSNISRIKLKAVLGNGRIVRKSLILKESKVGKAADKLAQDFSLFDSEAKMYSVIFKEMEFLMEEFEDQEDSLWCKFIFYDRIHSSLLLEDLKPIGFKMVPRQIGLDLEHALLILRNLGRYHAMTKVLEERGVISKDSYKPFALLADSYYIKTCFYGGIKAAAKGIRKYWGPKWESLSDKLYVPLDIFIEKIENCARQEEGMFACLNHGDCWSNNMMFRYDWQNRPISVKFVDFQGPHYNTPCVDVTNFIYLSIQPKVRRHNYRLLLENYYQSLIRNLEKYRYVGQKPSLEDIEKVMERLSLFGLSYFTAFYSVVTSESTEAFDMEKVFQTGGEEGFNLEIYKEEGLVEKVEPDLTNFAEKLCAYQ